MKKSTILNDEKISLSFKKLGLALTCSALFVCTSNSFGAQPSAAEIVKRADRIRFPQGDVTFKVKIDDYDGAKKVNSTLLFAQARGNEASLVNTIAPENKKGRKLLMLKDNLWFYVKTIRRPQRIPMQDKLVGEVANGDIARTNFADDYGAELIGMDKINKKKVYKLALKALRKEVTYQKLIYWVDAKTFAPLQVHFFSTSGKLLKVGQYGHFKKIGKVLRPMLLTITDAVDKKKKSKLYYSELKSTKLNDAIFNTESLSGD